LFLKMADDIDYDPDNFDASDESDGIQDDGISEPGYIDELNPMMVTQRREETIQTALGHIPPRHELPPDPSTETEKPWLLLSDKRHKLDDYFNYGLTEETWKVYRKHLIDYFSEMQYEGQIHCYDGSVPPKQRSRTVSALRNKPDDDPLFSDMPDAISEVVPKDPVAGHKAAALQALYKSVNDQMMSNFVPPMPMQLQPRFVPPQGPMGPGAMPQRPPMGPGAMPQRPPMGPGFGGLSIRAPGQGDLPTMMTQQPMGAPGMNRHPGMQPPRNAYAFGGSNNNGFGQRPMMPNKRDGSVNRGFVRPNRPNPAGNNGTGGGGGFSKKDKEGDNRPVDKKRNPRQHSPSTSRNRGQSRSRSRSRSKSPERGRHHERSDYDHDHDYDHGRNKRDRSRERSSSRHHTHHESSSSSRDKDKDHDHASSSRSTHHRRK